MAVTASVEVQAVAKGADEIAAIMYEISGHYGKIAHLYTKLAAMREKFDAECPTNDSAAQAG